MRNKLFFIVFLGLLVPQLALASWWNPFSWFNNSDTKTQVLEQRIKELENKLNATSSDRVLNDFSQTKALTAPKISTKTQQQIQADLDAQQKAQQEQDALVMKYKIQAQLQADAQADSVKRAQLESAQQAAVDRKAQVDAINRQKSLDVTAQEQKAQIQQQADATANMKNSPECQSATAALNSVRSQMKPLEDQSKANNDIYLKTGDYSAITSQQNSSIDSKLADLSVRAMGLETEYYRVCENYYVVPPKVYNTNCYYVGSSLNCTTY